MSLKGKKKASNDSVPEPVKAEPKDDHVGGIFTYKLAAIMQKLFKEWKKKLEKEAEEKEAE